MKNINNFYPNILKLVFSLEKLIAMLFLSLRQWDKISRNITICIMP